MEMGPQKVSMGHGREEVNYPRLGIRRPRLVRQGMHSHELEHHKVDHALMQRKERVSRA